ncbi:hypothetical protein BpHYR1_033455 [Brachionus plicatilis]|uniref:SWIM-type domain-containing protein n=1 Tax=Brachionus plicatilis TaxID=10195 RepID=A0A3M7PW59_BRAPC|nr:hypothetical protein BpHYR1_033455 [Brachionus plicatilis]
MINIESDDDFCYDFDQFVLLNRFIKRVKLNKDDWQLSTCTCKNCLKNYLCKHIVAMAVKTKLTEIDFSFRDIGMKKKRERNAQAKEWFVKNTN